MLSGTASISGTASTSASSSTPVGGCQTDVDVGVTVGPTTEFQIDRGSGWEISPELNFGQYCQHVIDQSHTSNDQGGTAYELFLSLNPDGTNYERTVSDASFDYADGELTIEFTSAHEFQAGGTVTLSGFTNGDFNGSGMLIKRVPSSDCVRISLSTTIQTGYEWHEHLEAIIDLSTNNPKLEVKANNKKII